MMSVGTSVFFSIRIKVKGSYVWFKKIYFNKKLGFELSNKFIIQMPCVLYIDWKVQTREDRREEKRPALDILTQTIKYIPTSTGLGWCIFQLNSWNRFDKFYIIKSLRCLQIEKPLIYLFTKRNFKAKTRHAEQK